jgi:CubicO group peptidase (beta-lactamase class C family)
MPTSTTRAQSQFRNSFCVLALALVFLLTARSPASLTIASDVDDVGPATDLVGILTPIRDKHKLPALAAVIAVGDRVVASGAVGVRARGFETPVTIDDRFHLGSCTKAMTATLVGVLVDEGRMRFDATLPEVLPELAAGMHEQYRTATVRHLLQNRAGVPGDLNPHGVWAELWRQDGAPTEKRRRMARSVLSRPPRSTPGTTFEYSNGSYMIAGLIAEVATGSSWEDLMRAKIFEPLGITTAGFGAPGTPRTGDEAPDQPRGHGKNGRPVEPGPQADNPPALGPAGTVHMSLPDWAKFVAVHLRGSNPRSRDAESDARSEGEADTTPGAVAEGKSESGAVAKPLVSEVTLRELHAFPADAKPGSPGSDYAMGWARLERPWAGGTALTHSGSNTMWFAVAWLAPERGFSILIATNAADPNGPAACDEVAAALIKHAQRHAENARAK